LVQFTGQQTQVAIPAAENTILLKLVSKLPYKQAGFDIPRKGDAMLYYAVVFLLVALVAGALGFGFVAFAAAGIAKVLFVVFLVLFLLSLVSHLTRTSVP
jgi:uncharacterized membrane protein YtjA (UPF0391 family)